MVDYVICEINKYYTEMVGVVPVLVVLLSLKTDETKDDIGISVRMWTRDGPCVVINNLLCTNVHSIK